MCPICQKLDDVKLSIQINENELEDQWRQCQYYQDSGDNWRTATVKVDSAPDPDPSVASTSSKDVTATFSFYFDEVNTFWTFHLWNFCIILRGDLV